jgi:hypothetical protein
MKTRRINRSVGTSYGLKHAVEHWWERKNPRGNNYVSNGAFLMAAHRRGFVFKGKRGMYYFHGEGPQPDTLNAWLNISRRRADVAA